MPLFGPPNIAQMEAKRDVSGLMKALNYKDPSIRVAAADALGPMRDPDAVEPLTNLVRDPDVDVRRAAVRALSARGGVRVVEPLVAALRDPDQGVRTAADTAVYRHLMTDPDNDARRETANLLGKLKATDAIEPLIKSIMDVDEGVRVASIKALGAIGDKAAVGPLIIVVAHEQVRARTTGRSSLTVERVAGQVLDALCDDQAIEALEHVARHEDADVREIAVRRLAHLNTPAVASSLAGSLDDPDPVIRRSAARGLAEIGWQPPSDEVGARYWAALRDWRRCAQCGPAAVPLLSAAFPKLDPLEKSDVITALIGVDWEPTEPDLMAAHYWAARGDWARCVEIGAPAVPVLDGILHNAPVWRDKLAAATALKTMGEVRTYGFADVDMVGRALAIFDAEATEEERLAALKAFVGKEHLVTQSPKQHLEVCACGYPAKRARKDGDAEPIPELLGFQQNGSDSPEYFCPNCGASQTEPAPAE